MTNGVGVDPIKESERKRKLSESKKGENHPMFGKHHTEEARRKMSEAHKGKHHTEEARRKMSEAHMRTANGKTRTSSS